MASIPNPRRILAVSLDDATDHLSRVVRDLTGSAPEPASTSLAGTTHDLPLSTNYYKATIPIWLDVVASPSEWAESFLSPEAKEVLSVLGGVVVVFPLPGTARTRDFIGHMGRVVRDGLGGWSWDGVSLAVGVGGAADATDEWDDLCGEAGLEFVHVAGAGTAGRNEFGEKTGIPRVKEALETNDWAQIDDLDAGLRDDDDEEFGAFEDDGDNSDGDLDPSKLEFGFDRADFDGLREAIWTSGVPPPEDDEDKKENGANGADKDETDKKEEKETKEGQDLDDDDIAKVESMMRRLQAVREAGEGMDEAQRRRMAARAVQEVMKEL